MKNENLLGIFDSGIGGFSVYKELRKVSSVDMMYYGDCLRAPYGNKGEKEIVSYIKEIMLTLKSSGVTHYVSACNSMSVLTTKKLLSEISITEDNYFDMIDAFKNIPFLQKDKVLILGTRATISSSVYQDILSNKGVLYEVFTPADLAGSIEYSDESSIIKSCDEAISIAKNSQCTHVVYACTHYPLVHEYFIAAKNAYKWEGEFIDPAVYLAKIIQNLNLLGASKTVFETSLATEAFSKLSTFYATKDAIV